MDLARHQEIKCHLWRVTLTSVRVPSYALALCSHVKSSAVQGKSIQATVLCFNWSILAESQHRCCWWIGSQLKPQSKYCQHSADLALGKSIDFRDCFLSTKIRVILGTKSKAFCCENWLLLMVAWATSTMNEYIKHFLLNTKGLRKFRYHLFLL